MSNSITLMHNQPRAHASRPLAFDIPSPYTQRRAFLSVQVHPSFCVYIQHGVTQTPIPKRGDLDSLGTSLGSQSHIHT